MPRPVPKVPALPAVLVHNDNPWKVVVFAADCDEDGNCPNCAIDYGECSCYGPTEDGLEYEYVNGILMARKSK